MGDSSGKNSSFNMEMSRAKANMVYLKHELSIAQTLAPTDVIGSLPTINPTFMWNSAHDETHSMNFQNGLSTNFLDKKTQH